MNSFEDVNIENLLRCTNGSNAAGLRTKIYFAPLSYFARIDLPSNPSFYQDFVNLAQNSIEFGVGGWNSIDVLVGENELKLNLVGSTQRKKIKSELEIFIPGFRSEVLGFIDRYKNTPLVFVVVDANGNNWVIGNLFNAAFIDSADVSTQKKYEDSSGASTKIICNSKVFYFGNSQSWIDEGIFTREFTDEFNFEFT